VYGLVIPGFERGLVCDIISTENTFRLALAALSATVIIHFGRWLEPLPLRQLILTQKQS
jgi:hypothetical protein